MAAEVVNTMADNNYDKAINKAMQRLLIKAGIIIEGDAITKVPIDTGRLRGSITYATKGKRSRVRDRAKPSDAIPIPSQDNEVHIGTNVEYAQHVEYGTVRSAKQPFMRPALDNNRSEITRVLGLEIHKGLERGK